MSDLWKCSERIGFTFMTELNNRQIELYGLMRKAKSISIPSIFLKMDHHYHRYEEKSSKANSSAYRKLRADVLKINKSKSQYAILPIKKGGKTTGYKLADANELILERADNYHKRAMRLLETEKALRLKVKNDNQFRITDDGVKAISSTVEG